LEDHLITTKGPII